ncbi:MAG: hypothetical protein IPK80_35915 [Nannocystis sp.]|nr:hypothetical protein [Nannocystis sp.]
MLRALTLLAAGWILLAAVAGLGHSLSVTVMLPATSAVLITYLAYEREGALPVGLALAVALGYLEDLHQGTPRGALSLAYALTYLVLAWTSLRLAPSGLLARSLAAGLAILAVDLLTYLTLTLLADPLGIARGGLAEGLRVLHWHALATVLATPPIWSMLAGIDGALRRIGGQTSPGPTLDRPPLIPWKRP